MIRQAILVFLFLTSLQGFSQEKYEQKVDSLCTLSYEAYGNYEFAKALDFAEQALVLSQGADFSEGKLKSNFYKIIAQEELSPSSFDPKSMEILIPQFQKAGFDLEEARAHTFLAGIYSFYGDLEKAIQNHLMALDIYERKKDILGVASVHNNLSLIYYDQHDYEEAFSHARISMDLEKKEGDPRRIHSSLNNLAIIFEHTGPVDSAIYYHQMALDIAYEINNPYSIGLSLSNLGNNYAAKGDLDLAEKTLLQALQVRDSLGYSRGIAYTHNRLANLYLQKGEFAKSKLHAEKSLENAEKASEVKVIRMAYERLMEVAEKTGDIRSELTYLKKASTLKDSILNESNTKEITQMMLKYEFNKEQLLDSIQNAQVLREQSLLFDERLKVERNQRIIFMISGVLFLVLAVGWWRRYKFIKKASHIIEREKGRSDKLLLNILPLKVAEELKETGKSEARDFEEVTVIFTDFADFTKKAQHLTAKELVHELNICFKAFDQIMEEFGLEKIKTIGDAYLAAGGLNNHSCVMDVIHAALKIKEFITQRNFDPSIPSKAKFDMRIGINTGPVVAGIVGIKKFQYDIWGDTVNTAQRMEAACGLNKINISKTTYTRIKDNPDLCFEFRGLIPVKGKGPLSMWYVESRKNQIQKFQAIHHEGII
ncbi:MAG: tetratricopeptide repeat protein [Algoriphagus sp.]|uniref:adenylate/guanylate cyclase domain-containing protein n=1 Tax=Algoriphagus sp. TaxID=1872435 RepID=UPI001820F8A9|nr:adenylate/guanylate cyclase domain-containing protein [Algoriphagus sp.]NVJ85097.1 tetratricopeptide repeat protein [Algoriphagus sp.]